MGTFDSILKSARPKIPPFKPIPRSRSSVPHMLHLPLPAECNICGSEHVRIAHHFELYGKQYGHWPWVVLCDKCHSYVGLHDNTDIPFGTLADAATRAARKRVKQLFFDLAGRKKWSKNSAYASLAAAMNLPRKDCHFGMFSEEQCQQAEDVLNEYLLKDFLSN